MSRQPPSPHTRTVERAHAATLAGDDHAAAELLTCLLSMRQPETTAADTDLIAAATLWAQLHTRTDDAPMLARRWADYAHTAAERLHGWRHPVTVRAARVLAAVHQARGEHTDAYDIYSTVAAALHHHALDDAYHAAALT
jgi:hypothetical protein